MARAGYRSLYGDLGKLKDDSLLDDPAGGTGDDTELFELLLASTEWVDRYCNRIFYPLTAIRTFDGSGSKLLIVPDLISVTSLKADEDEDKTFEVTWATTDYWLQPYNAVPTKHWGHPYTSIVAREKGDKGTFLLAEQNYQIDGKWGYREVTENSGSLINDASGISSTGTSLTVDDGTDFQIGQTIKIESEQLLVTNIATNVLTVVRALNGTSGVSHVDDEQVDILGWPLAVERATLITAARLWKRAPSFEPFYVDADVDTDVRLLLDAYRSIAV